MNVLNFDLLWQEMTLALREPALLSAGESADGVDRFHAWYDAGGDGKPEAIWTKPLQGKKQVRLPHHRDAFSGCTMRSTRGATPRPNSEASC